MQFNVFFGNDNILPVSSAIYRQIFDIESLITCNQITLLISTGIPFFLFKYQSTGILIFPTSDSSTISEHRYKLSVNPSLIFCSSSSDFSGGLGIGCGGSGWVLCLLVQSSFLGTKTFPFNSITPQPYP